MNRKKRWIFVVLLILVTLLIVAGVIVYLLKSDKQEKMTGFTEDFREYAVQGDVVYAYGVTGIGTVEVKFPVTNLENSLEVEEVYVSSGDEVTEGTPLVKVTAESLELVRTELQEDLRAAELAYRAGVIEYEQSKIVAFYDKETTLLEGQHADAVYNESISGLSDNVEKAQEELEDAKQQIAEYTAALENNTYYEDYQVAYYEELYQENLELLKTKMDEWEVSWSEVTTGRTEGSGMVMRSVSGSDPNLHSQYVSILASLYQVLEQNLKDYEAALSGYEEAVADAQFNIQTLKLQINSLEKNYAQAKENYEINISQAELTKETSVSNAKKAENHYEATLEKAEADHDTLKDALEEARENMELFEKLIVDGYLYASEAGSILRMNVRNGGYISGESRLYTVRDTSEISITVSVPQKDVAGIAVGDDTIIQSENNGIYRGKVTAVNPISSSDSKTSITYSVTVSLNGNFDDLSANETVVVYFGMEG